MERETTYQTSTCKKGKRERDLYQRIKLERDHFTLGRKREKTQYVRWRRGEIYFTLKKTQLIRWRRRDIYINRLRCKSTERERPLHIKSSSFNEEKGKDL